MARTKTVKLETQLKKITWGESYTSLLLGMIVVVVIGLVIFSFAKSKGVLRQTSSVKDNTVTKEEQENNKQKVASLPKIYTVVAGDDLWTISKKLYKSGYNWVDIAKANKLANADIVYAGDKLVIPEAKPVIVAIEDQKAQELLPNVAIKGSSYTVVQGDNLWDISVRAYSDGYRFVELARANNLSNPNLIFAGNKLTIPR